MGCQTVSTQSLRGGKCQNIFWSVRILGMDLRGRQVNPESLVNPESVVILGCRAIISDGARTQKSPSSGRPEGLLGSD